MIRPVESTRTANTIAVRFDDGSNVELACPPMLIGDPVARLIVELDYIVARTTGDLRPQWRSPDAGDRADDLRQRVTEQMPETVWRGLGVAPAGMSWPSTPIAT